MIVTKTRVSAFPGTDLELLLRAHGIETLILLGVATGGVVLATLLAAFDADYELIVIRDCRADLDAELHQALLSREFPHIATVLTADEFQKILQA